MKKILFITPFFGRTGSEMQLFYILQNLNSQKIKPYLFTRDNGVLIKELPKNIPAYVGYKKHDNFLYRILRILLYAVNVNPIEFQLRLLQNKIKADYWYINTISNRDAYEIAQKLGIEVISHVHELPLSYSLVKYPTIKRVIESSLCIGCSEIVCEKLRDMGHKNVQLLYGFVDEKRVTLSNNAIDKKKLFNFKDGDFLWVVSGNTTTVKGVDFLIPLLKVLKANHKIIWIGNIEITGTMCYVEQAVKEHFSDRMFFVGKKDSDYYDYFNIGQAFLSLSREDSFPLVMIEAAHLGKPIVGFNSGGIKEFVNNDVGIVVDQFNFQELAAAMYKVENDYDLYDSKKIVAHANRFSVKNQIETLNTIIEKNLFKDS